MTDHEFLDYCETHCRGESARFDTDDIVRLHHLGGDEIAANQWRCVLAQFVYPGEHYILPLVKKARERLAAGVA